MRASRTAWLAALALSLGACLPVPDPVFDARGEREPREDGLRRVLNSGFRVGWIRPDGWARRYDALAAQFVGISYRSPPRWAADAPPGRDDYALPHGAEEQLLTLLAEIAGEELDRDGGLRRVQARGPEVLLVRVELVDLVLHVPLAYFRPDDFLWIDSAGELTVVIDLLDSTTDARLGRFLDRAELAREGFGPVRGTPGPVGYEVRRIFRGWARNLRLVIDAMRAREAAS